jgi:hypothetical protein
MASTQKQIMDKIKYYRNQADIYTARGQAEKASHAWGRADGLEEAYKIFISEGANS